MDRGIGGREFAYYISTLYLLHLQEGFPDHIQFGDDLGIDFSCFFVEMKGSGIQSFPCFCDSK